MQTILALIFTYLVFITPTWAITRAVVIADTGLAILYDFTPLRLVLDRVETGALCATLALFLTNVAVTSYRSAAR